jgi:hypothetical protein
MINIRIDDIDLNSKKKIYIITQIPFIYFLSFKRKYMKLPSNVIYLLFMDYKNFYYH